MKNKTITFFILIFSLSLFGDFYYSPSAQASIELVKSSEYDTIYYVDSYGARHPFPNKITYQSWYGNDFSKVITISAKLMENYPLGKNITIRPGKYLAKVRTSPKVYALEQGGVLREIQNEIVAELLYGKGWNQKIVDIPEVFFGDYEIGKPIKDERDIPNGILYKIIGGDKYYYKNNSIIREFFSLADLKANNFEVKDAIEAENDYHRRERPIIGLDKNVFNPVASVIKDRRDCENKNLKAAVIFLADKEYNAGEVEKVEKIKKQISDRFSWATSGFSKMNVDYPTVIMSNDGYFLEKKADGTTDVKNEAINAFYDANLDVFDFIIIWTNFKIPSENTSEIASFVQTSNKWTGINRFNFDWSYMFGGTGKLKGIVIMGNVNKYNIETEKGMNETLNYVMHEILHNSAAYTNFIDSKGKISNKLLRSDDYKHWSYYAGFISPLGGSGWIDNFDGTFTNGLSKLADSGLRQYSNLDLYLMGLIPKQFVDPIMIVEPDIPGAVGNRIFGKKTYVTIDQIIAANGNVMCF